MIRTEGQGAVRTVTLQHGASNALDLPLLRQLYRVLCGLEQEKQVKGVLLCSGVPSVFSTGLSLGTLEGRGASLRLELLRAVRLCRRINRLILRSRKVYTAWLSGAVVGSGMSLAMACDFRFCSGGTWFWLPDPLYGGLLADGGIELVTACAGTAAAKQILLTNRKFNSRRAYDMGLVQEISGKDGLQEAEAFLREITALAPSTLSATKRMINYRLPGRFRWRCFLGVLAAPGFEQRFFHHRKGRKETTDG